MHCGLQKTRLKGSWEIKIKSDSKIGKEVPWKLREMCDAVPSCRLPVIAITRLDPDLPLFLSHCVPHARGNPPVGVQLFCCVLLHSHVLVLVSYSRWSFAREEEALPVVNLVTGETIVTSKSIFSSLLEGYNFK